MVETMGKKSLSGEEGGSAKAREKTRSNGTLDPESLIGETLDGRYEIEKPIGRGGMGVVYLASQNALERKVVIKVLPASFIGDEEASARFEREARGMSRLQHPHIVAIYDFGYRDDQAYIVMEYVEGITLRQLIRSDKQMDLATFGAIGLQLLEGISEAHSMGLVHRDIKPSNIMLTERRGEKNYVKILDFGLAKLVKGAQDVTKEQNLVGSVAFLAPEQIMGNDTDERVDVYALGVLFYYMLTGDKPFTGDDDVAVLYQHVHNDPEPLGEVLAPGHDITEPIIDLIHRALSKDPADRPSDAGEFLAEFGACLEGTDISSPHVSGEFNAVSRVVKLSNITPDDPSDQLSRQRRETPIHQIPADATPSHSGLVAMGSETSSGQVTWVSGEHLLKVEKQNRLRNILLGLLGAVLVAGAAAFFYLRQADVPSQNEVRGDLAQVVALIDDGKLGQAESSLGMVELDLKHYPDLRTEFVAAQDKLETAQLMADGAFYEDEGDIEQAVAAYKDVLSRDRSHQGARERLEALRSEVEEIDDLEVDLEPVDEPAEEPELPAPAHAQPEEPRVDVAPVASEKKSADGARAPQEKQAAGAAKARSGDSKSKSVKTADSKAGSAKAGDSKAGDSKATSAAKPEKSAAKDEASSKDDDLLLPADDAAPSKDQGTSDLLPADDDGSGSGLLLD
jgi:serine/threonine protein kinase